MKNKKRIKNSSEKLDDLFELYDNGMITLTALKDLHLLMFDSDLCEDGIASYFKNLYKN